MSQIHPTDSLGTKQVSIGISCTTVTCAKFFSKALPQLQAPDLQSSGKNEASQLGAAGASRNGPQLLT